MRVAMSALLLAVMTVVLRAEYWAVWMVAV